MFVTDSDFRGSLIFIGKYSNLSEWSWSQPEFQPLAGLDNSLVKVTDIDNTLAYYNLE